MTTMLDKMNQGETPKGNKIAAAVAKAIIEVADVQFTVNLRPDLTTPCESEESMTNFRLVMGLTQAKWDKFIEGKSKTLEVLDCTGSSLHFNEEKEKELAAMWDSIPQYAIPEPETEPKTKDAVNSIRNRTGSSNELAETQEQLSRATKALKVDFMGFFPLQFNLYQPTTSLTGHKARVMNFLLGATPDEVLEFLKENPPKLRKLTYVAKKYSVCAALAAL